MPSNPGKSELAYLIELANRRVRTLAGAKLYGKPIGAVIGEVGDTDDANKRPITYERLQSLQRQFLAAKRTGNTSAMKDIQAEFSKAYKEYAATRQGVSALSKLQNESGNHEQDIQRS